MVLPNIEMKSGTGCQLEEGQQQQKSLTICTRKHDSFVKGIIYCHSGGLALLTHKVFLVLNATD